MLSEIELRDFKCFPHLTLPLAPLCLLTGHNGAGKSSVLQSLLLVHQTIREHEWSPRLALNGEAVSLGRVPDVVNEMSGGDRFSLALCDGDDRVEWTFRGDRRHLSMAVDTLRINGDTAGSTTQLRHLLPIGEAALRPLTTRLRGLTYIGASRAAPEEIHALSDPTLVDVVGARGEHAVSVLHWARDRPVEGALAIAEPRARDLIRQVQARMRQFFPGFGLEVREMPGTNAVRLGLRTSDRTEYHRPRHTGLGLTQCLPIVVAALSARDDAILLIESPELHLHPAGQARMGRFLAEVARAGRQVIVETHSDHVLNGVRRAVKDGTVSSEEVAIHFFQPRTEDRPQVSSPVVGDDGRIDFWPSGFFDQFDRDASYFAGWSEGED